MEYIIGAYATAPSTVKWDKALETQFYQELKAINNIAGLEHPFTGQLHAYDDDWFLDTIDKEWQFIFTSIPGVMGNLASNPHFGIASNNEEGRQAALAFYQKAQQAILKLNNHLGRKSVSFMKVHTAPRITADNRSSISALEASLKTLHSWDWNGAKLVIEHCDAYVQGQPAEKGFMTIEDEIVAIKNVNDTLESDIGISLNWGRSAIETRSTTGPLQHIKKAFEAGLLKGVIFSGASGIEGDYGQWKDTHMPPAQAFNVTSYAENSELTANQIAKAFEQCQGEPLDFIGGKISLSPNNATVVERISYIQSLITIIENVILAIKSKS
tara:strand:- start:25118 stop:26098 length:981 start_codon:yes stop_codon:yes gene_type:complete